MRNRLAAMLLASVVLVIAACGGGSKPSPGDDDDDDDPPAAVCGNGVKETGEACDDGDTVPDALCDASCKVTCGNGVLDDTVGELCDSGIANGAGACPIMCDDGLACTADVLSGSGCQAACVASPITSPANSDGCCPDGANSLNDDDCAVVCGNALVEAGETCDTTITSGAGACPASCDDQAACTTDVLSGAGTCTAACANTPITTPVNGDGCCPPGSTPLTDNDCVGCGNGVVDAGETCDISIASGPGSCPTACSDGAACTSDVLADAGTCTAVCTFPPVTTPVNGDGCCPDGANANNDNDCAPRCGNNVVEAGEACDDGNANNNDSCSNTCQINIPPSAFRLRDLDLRDPHVFVSVPIFGCRDVTDAQLFGFAVNNEIQTGIQTDGDNPADGLLDLSIAAVFRPLNQGGTTSALEIHFPSCTAPLASTACSRNPAASAPIAASATNMSAGQCLGTLAGTTFGYSPAISTPSGPCFVSDSVSVTVNVAGILITLVDARIAAAFVGNPANNTVNGLLRGFISETDANNTVLPDDLPVVGGEPLSLLLPGGRNNCSNHSDIDVNNGVRGWWFYLNFTAPRVGWTDN